MVVSMMFVFGAFNHTHLDRRSGQTGFPNRLFTYPVATRVLIAVPMVCGVLVTVAVYLAWSTLVIQPLGRNLPVAWPAIVLASAMAWYQATLWSLAAFRMLRLITLCLLGTAMITVSLIPTEDTSGLTSMSGRALQLAMAAFGLVAYAFALLAVKRQRHAGGHGAGLRFFVERLLDLVPTRTKPFRSPAHAQFWLEVQRGSLYLPAGTLLVMLFLMFIAMLMRHVPADTTVITLTTICLTPVILALLTGSVAGMPLVTASDGSIAPFLATRPISTGDMVIAKLGAAALAATLAWVIVLVLTPIWLITWCDTTFVMRAWTRFSEMFPGRQRWMMVALCAMTWWLITWRMSVVNLYVAVSGRATLLTGYVIAGLALAITFVAIVCGELGTAAESGVEGTIFSSVVTLAWILNVVLVLKLALAASSTSKALLRGWVSGRAVGIGAGAWLSASFVVSLTLYELASREPTLARVTPWLGLLAALYGLLLVPLARIALATQALAGVRHR
jgi:hypothetical protein